MKDRRVHLVWFFHQPYFVSDDEISWRVDATYSPLLDALRARSIGCSLGITASLHLLLAYLYAANKIPFLLFSGTPLFTRKREGWTPIERNDAYFADVKKRETERAMKGMRD